MHISRLALLAAVCSTPTSCLVLPTTSNDSLVDLGAGSSRTDINGSLGNGNDDEIDIILKKLGDRKLVAPDYIHVWLAYKRFTCESSF